MAYRSKILFSALAFSVVSVKGQALAGRLQQGGMNDTIVLPSAPNYEAAAHDTFNQRLLYSPAAVVYP